MTHRYIRIACWGRLTIAAFDALAAKRASVWTAL
jgi:hypothetical protein